MFCTNIVLITSDQSGACVGVFVVCYRYTVCYVCQCVVVSMLESIKSTAVEKFSHTAHGGGSIVLSLPSRYLPAY